MGKNLLVTIGTGIEMCGIAALTYIALKRNNECYKAECKLIDAQKQLFLKELEIITKDIEIEKLKKKLNR